MAILVNGLDYCSTYAGLTYLRIGIMYVDISGPTNDEMKITLHSTNAAPKPLPSCVVPKKNKTKMRCFMRQNSTSHCKKRQQNEVSEYEADMYSQIQGDNHIRRRFLILIYTLHWTLLGNCNEDDEMSTTCSTYGNEKCTQNWTKKTRMEKITWRTWCVWKNVNNWF